MGSASNSKSSGAEYFHRDRCPTCSTMQEYYSTALATLLAILKWAVVGILWMHGVKFHIPATHSLPHTISPSSTTQLSSQEKTLSNNLSPAPNGYTFHVLWWV
jgi:hypothetical protein